MVYGGGMKASEFASKFKRNDKDSGSVEFQTAVLTHRINTLQEHFTKHKKDNHSMYGLLKMVNLRRRLLRYLKTTEFDRYKKLIDALGLRK